MRRQAMHGALMAIAVAFTFTSGEAMAQARGPKPDVGDGRIAWFDLTTNNMKQSQEFYGKLFGWSFAGMKGTDFAAQIVAGGAEIGTLRVAEGTYTPFNGVVYIQVADMRAACKRATELGGTVVAGFPFDLGDGGGAVGLAVDPAGHPFGMYSRTALAPSAPNP